MVYAAGQSEESFERVRDAGFDLLRRHTRIKSCNHHNGNIDGWKQVHWHAHEGDCAYDGDDQTTNNNEKWIANGKAGHQLAPSGSLVCAGVSRGVIFSPLRNWLRLPITTRSCSVSPEVI